MDFNTDARDLFGTGGGAAADVLSLRRGERATLRILPAKPGAALMHSSWVHWNIAEKGPISITGSGKNNPATLLSRGCQVLAKEHKAHEKVLIGYPNGIAKQIGARGTFYLNVLQLPDQTIRPWRISAGGQNALEEITRAALKAAEAAGREFVSPVDPERGRNLIVYLKPKGKDKLYDWEMSWDIEASPIPYKNWAEELPDLTQFGNADEWDHDDVIRVLEQKYDKILADLGIDGINGVANVMALAGSYTPPSRRNNDDDTSPTTPKAEGIFDDD